MSEKKFKESLENAELLTDVQREYYPVFQKEEGIPIYTGYYFNDLRTIGLEPWSRMGGLGAFVNLLGEETLSGNYLSEIPPGETLKPQRHMYEELVFVLYGVGRHAAITVLVPPICVLCQQCWWRGSNLRVTDVPV